jgi:carboxyl-terminal processing protease
MFSRSARVPRLTAQIVAALLILIIGVWLGGHPSWLPSSLRGTFADNSDGRLVHDALDLLAKDYYRPIDRNQLVNKGLASAVASLQDPFSHYFSPSDYRGFLDQSNPHLSGIGIDVLANPLGLRVADVFPNSPAARAGLAAGDVIFKVGSTTLAGHSADFASRLIKGPAGTQVILTVMRGGHSRVVKITRANLTVPVATGSIVNFHGVKLGDLRLTSFTDGSGGELKTQVNRALKSGARALILDLRENGGGLLNEAVTVGSIFLPDGTIVSTAGRSQPRQVYVAKGGAIPVNIPLVVLVDHGTASAAEIVSGAVQDRQRAKVVGTRTFGKGVFQEIQTLPNGGALEIVTGQWFTPSGHNVGGPGVKEGAGIKPNVFAASDPRASDDRALTVAERTVAAEVR